MPDESVEVRPLEDWLIDHRWPDAYDLARAILASEWLAKHDAKVRAEALREAADSLTWVRPEVCPCERPEGCCGSEASCDAMQPHAKVVGQSWLRERADRIAREGGA